MKKKTLSVLIASALILSLAGCTGSTETPESTIEGAEVTTTAAAEEEKTEAPAETEETTTTTEAPKEVPKITVEPIIMNNDLIFKADGKTYIFNIDTKKMYEYEGTAEVTNLYGNVAYMHSKYKYYNIEEKEYYDGDVFKYEALEFNPVYKLEESFDGNTFSFGIINKDGEWELPLSSEYSVCSQIDNHSFIVNVTSSMVEFSSPNIIYNYKNDKIISKEDLFPQIHRWYTVNDDMVVFCAVDPDTYKECYYKYNTSTDELTLLCDYEYAACERLQFISGVAWIYNDYDAAIKNFVYDEEINKVHDLEYASYNVYAATDDYVVFAASNTNSITDMYALFLDKDSNRICEPIKIKDATSCKACIIGDYILFDQDYYGSRITDGGKASIINCKTGEVTDFEYEDISHETGMLLTEKDGEYYLVHVSDPETLINPFEIAE